MRWNGIEIDDLFVRHIVAIEVEAINHGGCVDDHFFVETVPLVRRGVSTSEEMRFYVNLSRVESILMLATGVVSKFPLHGLQHQYTQGGEEVNLTFLLVSGKYSFRNCLR